MWHQGSEAAVAGLKSIWRRKKEMGKDGLMVAKEIKRLQSHPVRFERFMTTPVSHLLKSDLVAVLAEFQRQNIVSLSLKLYDMVWCGRKHGIGEICSYTGIC
ncbi:Pentatricopeptide repeat-containing protein [Sesamum alatum]|uniref:Pentatricopeptide repeat-containing protein n=1 Tax=Sesamum alatum TaxID=300844 RepID=A0AAE2CGL7_9LAMI|nr:Pentatricopeptide repeat-containing protein [Sesamum alatum]